MAAAWGKSAANMALVSKQANQSIDSSTVLHGKKMSQKAEEENNYQSNTQQLDIKLRGQNPHKLNSSQQAANTIELNDVNTLNTHNSLRVDNSNSHIIGVIGDIIPTGKTKMVVNKDLAADNQDTSEKLQTTSLYAIPNESAEKPDGSMAIVKSHHFDQESDLKIEQSMASGDAKRSTFERIATSTDKVINLSSQRKV